MCHASNRNESVLLSRFDLDSITFSCVSPFNVASLANGLARSVDQSQSGPEGRCATRPAKRYATVVRLGIDEACLRIDFAATALGEAQLAAWRGVRLLLEFDNLRWWSRLVGPGASLRGGGSCLAPTYRAVVGTMIGTRGSGTTKGTNCRVI